MKLKLLWMVILALLSAVVILSPSVISENESTVEGDPQSDSDLETLSDDGTVEGQEGSGSNDTDNLRRQDARMDRADARF